MTDTTLAPTMRYISRVRLENFQSHTDSTINLEPGINLITGSSDAGKSAILRGINWAMHNKPSGKGFIKNGAAEARVTLWFSDGTMIQRIKGDTRNAIVIKKSDGTESAYDRFGNEYPEEVLDALGHPPTDDKHGPISYAEQMGPYFLVSLTPTELPRILAEMTRLDDIQDAADLLAKRAREKDRQIKQGTERIERFISELEEFSGLDTDLARQEVLNKRAARVDNLASLLKAAREIVARYKEIMVQGKTETKARDRAAALAIFAPDVSTARSQADQVIAMWSVAAQVLELDSQIQKTERDLAFAQSLATGDIQETSNQLKNELTQIQKMRSTLDAYKEVMRQGAKVTKERDQAQTNLDNLQAEQEVVRQQIIKAGLWCAACERPLDTVSEGHLHDK